MLSHVLEDQEQKWKDILVSRVLEDRVPKGKVPSLHSSLGSGLASSPPLGEKEADAKPKTQFLSLGSHTYVLSSTKMSHAGITAAHCSWS